MKLIIQSPQVALNKAYLKQKVLKDDILKFTSSLNLFYDKIDPNEREENQKFHIRDFLIDAHYRNKNQINTKDNIDLAIFLDNEQVGVIIEVKKPSNKIEMISKDQPNAKALHELVLYYLKQRVEKKNDEIKHLIATNLYEWYIFDAVDFERIFYKNKEFLQKFNNWHQDQSVSSNTDHFYNQIAKPYLDKIGEIPCTYFNINNYSSIFENPFYDFSDNSVKLQEFISLYKLLSPFHLLKKFFENDSNALDLTFYRELLYIMGLEEAKVQNRIIIRRCQTNRQPGSLIENIYIKLASDDDIRKKIYQDYGQDANNNLPENVPDPIFEVALQLCLLWINRILFLKLLEGQLVAFNKNNKTDSEYRFLTKNSIKDYDDLYELFFKVLAIPQEKRDDQLKEKYANVPYLNSSLFEELDIEKPSKSGLSINQLNHHKEIAIYSSTVLKDYSGKKKNGKTFLLNYLFDFLDAYDFSRESSNIIAEQQKTIINASVLGKLFEKINGYKDGAIFTPAPITMFMAQQSIRPVIVQKFNERYNWHCNDFDDVKNYLHDKRNKEDILEANSIVNSIKICDPAVGSGHFLVACVNELIACKSDLGILADSNGVVLNVRATVDNDELIFTNKDDNSIYEYKPNFINNKLSNNAAYSQNEIIQKSIFEEKQTIIENCLFGVDIEEKSVQIARLRLWIELLKNSFYKYNHNNSLPQLETLPNIDINIKTGNSLLSQFSVNDTLTNVFKVKDTIYSINSYRDAVKAYKSTTDKANKRKLRELIDIIKFEIVRSLKRTDNNSNQLEKLKKELYNLTQTDFFGRTEEELIHWQNKVYEINAKIQELEAKGSIEIEAEQKLFKNAFEWRYEFPEILDDEGEFIGFDIIIGNPPYIQLQKAYNQHIKFADLYKNMKYTTFDRMGDIYCLFYERGVQILKNDGILAYITSNKWMRAGYGKKLRVFLLTNNPKILIDLGPGIFDSVTVDTSILFLHKPIVEQQSPESVQIRAATYTDKTKSLNETLEFNSVILKNLSEDAWFIGNDDEQKLKEKIERIGKPLKDWDVNIYYGIKTGLNDAFIIESAKRQEILDNCKDDDERRRTEAIIKPILRGRDIKRYSYEWAGLWVIFIPWHFPLHNDTTIQGASNKAELEFQRQYPTIYNHLLEFKEKLIKRNREETGIRYEWYALQRCAATYYPEFEKEKVVWTPVNSEYSFTIIPEGIYFVNSVFMCTGPTIKLFCSVFNSKLIRYYLTFLFSNEEVYTYASKENITKLPIPPITPSNQPIVSQIELLVDKILAAKKVAQPSWLSNSPEQDAPATIHSDTTEWEKEIDQLVYQLYDLTDAEIAVVEGEGIKTRM